MTTVVALARADGVWMSADTGTNVYDRPVTGVEKIRRLYDVDGHPVALAGVAGSGGALHILREVFEAERIVALGANDDPEVWSYEIAARLTRAMVEAGLVDQETGLMDATVLLAVPGHVWTIEHHMAIRSPDGRGAIGSGEGPATGALDALLESVALEPGEVVRRAIRIAVCRDRWSLGPLQHEALIAR